MTALPQYFNTKYVDCPRKVSELFQIDRAFGLLCSAIMKYRTGRQREKPRRPFLFWARLLINSHILTVPVKFYLDSENACFIFFTIEPDV